MTRARKLSLIGSSLLVLVGLAGWGAIHGCNPSGGDNDAGPPGTATDSGGGEDSNTPPPPPPPPPSGEWFDNPRDSARVFATGHSLIDQVFGGPDPITSYARASGKDHMSQLQGGPGSTARLRRMDIESGEYPRPDWSAFDTFIITERVDLVSTMRYEFTLDSVGWFVDQAIAGGNAQEIFFYQTWYAYQNATPYLNTWSEWIQYTRDERRLYECVAERVGSQRGVRVHVAPVATALADLMLAIEEGRAGSLQPSDLFEDYIHMREGLGSAFISMVFFATVYHTPTAGLQHPDVPAEHAELFSTIVDQAVDGYYAQFEPPSVQQCREVMGDFCRRYGDPCDEDLAVTFPDGAF